MIIDRSPFWFFQKKNNHYQLNYSDTSLIKVKTIVSLSKHPRMKAEFLTRLDLNLIEKLEEQFDLISEGINLSIPKDLTKRQFILSVVASTRFSDATIIKNDSCLDSSIMRDIESGDIVVIMIDNMPMNLFVTGVFSSAMQGVCLKSSTEKYRVFENIYLSHI
jgi:hypothetical protein